MLTRTGTDSVEPLGWNCRPELLPRSTSPSAGFRLAATDRPSDRPEHTAVTCQQSTAIHCNHCGIRAAEVDQSAHREPVQCARICSVGELSPVAKCQRDRRLSCRAAKGGEAVRRRRAACLEHSGSHAHARAAHLYGLRGRVAVEGGSQRGRARAERAQPRRGKRGDRRVA
eukprot:scaffold99475_cov72-Phaeocystis_antarctica.AAC.2